MASLVHKGQFISAAAAVGEITGIYDSDVITIVISGLTTETIAVTGLVHLNVYTISTGMRPINLSTGATEATDSALSNGSFRFQQIGTQSLKFTKSGTSETVTITYLTHSQHD
jgi:hypothetical protein